MNEDKATRYHRLKRRAGLLSVIWGGGLLVALLGTGGSVALRDAATAAAARPAAPAWLVPSTVVAVYVVLLAAVSEIGALPLAFYRGFLLEHRYGLSAQRAGGWLRDHVKASALGLAFGLAAAILVYLAIARWPRGWWLPAAAGFSLFTVVLARLGPVLLLPLFHRCKPLDREALRARLIALASRAGARVVGAFEWGLSEKTKKANAALTGLGATRRILVADNLLAEYSDDEIEVILAHELGHHVHHDIWKGILFEVVLTLGGFYLASHLLVALAPVIGLQGPADVAGLPLLSLTGGVLSLLLLPAANAISRVHERRADRFALDLTRNPQAFISAMRRLGAQNLAEENPSRLVRLVLHSHPPIKERIAAAERWNQ